MEFLRSKSFSTEIPEGYTIFIEFLRVKPISKGILWGSIDYKLISLDLLKNERSDSTGREGVADFKCNRSLRQQASFLTKTHRTPKRNVT